MTRGHVYDPQTTDGDPGQWISCTLTTYREGGEAGGKGRGEGGREGGERGGRREGWGEGEEEGGRGEKGRQKPSSGE